MDVSEYLKSYYESYDEDRRLSTSYGTVEFITIMRYIETYLTPVFKIPSGHL